MKTIGYYLDSAKKKTGSDYMTAKALHVSRQAVSTMRAREAISNEKAAELAEIIDVDPIQIIAAAEVAKHPEKAKFWAKWIAATVILSAGIMSQDIDSTGILVAAAFDHAIYYAHVEQLSDKSQNAVLLVAIMLAMAIMRANKRQSWNRRLV